MMKVKKLIKLLKKENPNAEAMVWLGAKKGWAIEQIGYGDAIIGRSQSVENDFVLIPVGVPDKFDEWADDQIIGKS